MIIKSCPHGGGLAYFPLLSAQCTGEYLGTIGFLLTSMPGIIVGISLTIYSARRFELTGIESQLSEQLSPEGQFLFVVVLSAIANVIAYWIIILLIALVIKRITIRKYLEGSKL